MQAENKDQAERRCSYPQCNCPFDAPGDPNWCARGLLPRLRSIDIEQLHAHFAQYNQATATAQAEPAPNEGRASEECRQASAAALLGPLKWVRDQVRTFRAEDWLTVALLVLAVITAWSGN